MICYRLFVFVSDSALSLVAKTIWIFQSISLEVSNMLLGQADLWQLSIQIGYSSGLKWRDEWSWINRLISERLMLGSKFDVKTK